MVDELKPTDVSPLKPGLLRPKPETEAPKTSFEQVSTFAFFDVPGHDPDSGLILHASKSYL